MCLYCSKSANKSKYKVALNYIKYRCKTNGLFIWYQSRVMHGRIELSSVHCFSLFSILCYAMFLQSAMFFPCYVFSPLCFFPAMFFLRYVFSRLCFFSAMFLSLCFFAAMFCALCFIATPGGVKWEFLSI